MKQCLAMTITDIYLGNYIDIPLFPDVEEGGFGYNFGYNFGGSFEDSVNGYDSVYDRLGEGIVKLSIEQDIPDYIIGSYISDDTPALIKSASFVMELSDFSYNSINKYFNSDNVVYGGYTKGITLPTIKIEQAIIASGNITNVASPTHIHGKDYIFYGNTIKFLKDIDIESDITYTVSSSNSNRFFQLDNSYIKAVHFVGYDHTSGESVSIRASKVKLNLQSSEIDILGYEYFRYNLTGNIILTGNNTIELIRG